MTDTTAVRRRASGVSPEHRRAMIVAAAVPLVAEYGTAVTTAKIARAAGIGEATIFRVFTDKDQLLDACVAEVLRADDMVAEIAGIPLDQPLPARLVQAAEALQAYFDRMGAVIGALHQSGHRNAHPGGHDSGHHSGHHSGHRGAPDPGAREAGARVVREAVTELLNPEQDQLRLPAEQVAGLLLNQLFSRTRQLEATDLTLDQLIDFFLHGVQVS